MVLLQGTLSEDKQEVFLVFMKSDKIINTID